MRLKKVAPTALLVSVMLLVSACVSVVPQPHARNAPITPQEVTASKLADNVLQYLQKDGLPIGESFTYTVNNDPDALLGTGNQYIGKVTFKDTRVPSETSKSGIDVLDGGCIEIFANMKDAKATEAYITQANQDGTLFSTEYDYWRGIILLRVTSQLTPAQAHFYQAILTTYPLLSSPGQNAANT